MSPSSSSLTLAEFVARHGLTLSSGAHDPSDPAQPGCAVCLQEAEALRLWVERRGEKLGTEWWREAWSDMPLTTSWADLRALNDAPWSSDALRTAHLVPLEDRLRDVPEAARAAVVEAVADHAVRVLVPMVLRAAAGVHPEAAHQEALERAAARCAAKGWAALGEAERVARAAAAGATAAGAAAYAAAAVDYATAGDTACAANVARAAASGFVFAARAAAATFADAVDAVLIEAVRGWHAAIDAAVGAGASPTSSASPPSSRS